MVSKERGYALILAVIAITVISTAVLLAGRHLQADLSDYQRELRDAKAVALLDAAMATTLAELARDPGSRGLAATAFGGGVISSRVTATVAAGRSLSVEARVADRRARLTATVTLVAGTPRVVAWERRLGH